MITLENREAPQLLEIREAHRTITLENSRDQGSPQQNRENGTNARMKNQVSE